ncbi:MAG TPA: lipopolysaccharide heptosyltransferase family protein, partial [Planctomycetaceae bacterium]|nr:lipopolysaccharide heptosyltransferase family protein [Planctomycetaceae bacterium]
MESQRLPRYERILLVRDDRLGDSILTWPAIRTVRTLWPEAHLTALVHPSLVQLWQTLPDVDEVVACQPGASARPLVRHLRNGRYDAACLFNTNRRNLWIAWRAKVPLRVAWAGRWESRLLANRPVRLRRSHPPIHEADFAGAFVRELAGGYPLPPRAPVRPVLPSSSRLRARRWMEAHLFTKGAKPGNVDRPVFIVHPGNRGSAPNWPIEAYAELARQL